jgi:hypothetical protein
LFDERAEDSSWEPDPPGIPRATLNLLIAAAGKVGPL